MRPLDSGPRPATLQSTSIDVKGLVFLSQKQSTPVVHRIPMTEARTNLGQLAKRAHVNNEYFILEKDGIPVIGIMDADELEDYLELQDATVREQIAQSNEDVKAGRTRPAAGLLTELKSKAASKSKARRSA